MQIIGRGYIGISSLNIRVLSINLYPAAPLSIKSINRIIILNIRKISIEILKDLLFIILKYKGFLDIIDLLIYKNKLSITNLDLRL